jgi:hypothetical protein
MSSTVGPIPAGQSASFTDTSTYDPIYYRPVQPTAQVTSVDYKDQSSGPGCAPG